MLDLQPGRTDFLTQAKRYEELLVEPHVGLALDPEWRLAPGQLHRVQIGSVNVDEINRVGDWLAGLVRDAPPAAEGADAAPVPHVDDRRPGAAEHGARRARGHDPRRRVRHPGHEARHLEHLAGGLPNLDWGWKNFIDEDRPMLDPTQTMQVSPDIVFVSYQ